MFTKCRRYEIKSRGGPFLVAFGDFLSRGLQDPMKRILFTIGFSIAATTTLMSQTHEERRKNIEKLEHEQPSKEALERKASSIARLKKEGVPTIDHLPVIEDSKQARTRTSDDIAKRAIAVCLTAVK